MQVKLLLGDYAYLYHGELILEEIHKQIQQLTKLPYTLKWRDSDDEMISVLRIQDLKQCIDYTKTKKQKTTLRLFIYEKTGDSGSIHKQKQNMQQSGQLNMQQSGQFTPIYSDLITPHTGAKFFPPTLQENKTSQQTFGEYNRDSQQKENNQPDISSFMPNNEKKDFCQNLVISKIEEFYPGMKEKILQESQAPLDLLKTYSEYQGIPCQPQFKKSNSIQDQIVTRFQSIISSDDQSNQFSDTPGFPVLGQQQKQEFEMPKMQNKMSFGQLSELNMEESIATKKIENQAAIKEEFSNVSDENQGEDFFFCDYCSEEIPVESQYYNCPECSDLHICALCFDTIKENVHFHKLIAQKQ